MLSRILPCAFGLLLSTSYGATLNVQTQGGTTTLQINEHDPFHSTQSTVTQATLVEVSSTTLIIVYWKETPAGGSTTPYYAFAHDGHTFSRTRQANYLIKLLFAQFDPLVSIPSLPASLQADANVHLHIVQFFSQALKTLQDGVTIVGGLVHGALPPHAVVVEMSDANKTTVAALPYVRWVGPYHPGYRLESYLRDNWAQGTALFPTGTYNIVVFVAGTSQKDAVAARVQSIGGTVDVNPSDGYTLIATLTYAQLGQVIRWDEVEFVDRWSEPSVGMDVGRALGGAAILESVSGFTGAWMVKKASANASGRV